MSPSPENPLPESIENRNESKEHVRPVDFGFATERGGLHERLGRENEDSLFISGPGSEYFVAAIADGMGGHGRAKDASEKAITALAGKIGQGDQGLSKQDVWNAVELADQSVRSLRPDSNLRIMEKKLPGSTLVVLAEIDLETGRGWLIANIGDSRAYLVRAGKVQQLTIDQTYGEEKRAQGEVASKNFADLLTHCLGGDQTEFNRDWVDFYSVRPEPGDAIILASDGLEHRGAVSREDMAQAVSDSSVSAGQAAENLTLTAAGPNSDDVSVIVVKF